MESIWSVTGREIKNRSLAFVYDYKGKETKATVRICAANVWRIFLNGTLLGYGPRRSAHGYSNINEYAITLKANDRIVAEVAGYNINSYYVVDELPFFACEIYSDGKLLAQSHDFTCFELNDRVCKTQRYSFQRPFTEIYNMKKDRGVFYNGENIFPIAETSEVQGNIQQECNLPYPKFEISDCKQIECGSVKLMEEFLHYNDRSLCKISDILKGYLYDELEVKMSDEFGAFWYDPDSESGTELADRYCLYDFGRIVTGFISCKVIVKEKCDLYFLFDEILYPELLKDSKRSPYLNKESLPLVCTRMTTCNSVKYTLEPGEYNLLSFEPYEMRYLKVVCMNGKAETKIPQIIRYENADIYRAEFTCEDKDLEKIFLASQHTLAQNAVDVLTDCPGRERAGWLCDSFFSSRVERLLTGENKIEENLLDAYLKAPQLPQLPEGMFPMCYPADHYNGMYIPNWAMWLVIELEDYVRRTGNRSPINAYKGKIDALLKFFLRYENEDGLLENLESWVCVEHSKAAEFVQDVSYPTNMLYSRMYRSIYALYGDKNALIKAENIAETIRNQSYNGMFFEDNRVRKDGVLQKTGNISETCQYYAFFTGVADKKSFSTLYERMLKEFGSDRDCEKVYPNVYKSNAFIGNYLRLLYFYSQGEKKEVFYECKGYFLYMANRTMTLWEHDKPHASCNHAFASYPVIFFVNALTGFMRVDSSEKVIYFEKPVVKLNCSLCLPVNATEFLEITVKDGTITRKVPDGYSVKEM